MENRAACLLGASIPRPAYVHGKHLYMYLQIHVAHLRSTAARRASGCAPCAPRPVLPGLHPTSGLHCQRCHGIVAPAQGHQKPWNVILGSTCLRPLPLPLPLPRVPPLWYARAWPILNSHRLATVSWHTMQTSVPSSAPTMSGGALPFFQVRLSSFEPHSCSRISTRQNLQCLTQDVARLDALANRHALQCSAPW